MDLSNTIIPKSDQQNYEDYLVGPRTVTISEVRKGSSEQPVEIHLAEYPGRPYKPSKSMRRVLVKAWGPEASEYVGRRITLYGDPSVKFGGEAVGGIKISHLSHIEKPLEIALTVTRGKRANVRVQPLAESSVTSAPNLADRIETAVIAFDGFGVTRDQLAGFVGKPESDWTPADLDGLVEAFKALQAGALTAAELIGGEGA